MAVQIVLFSSVQKFNRIIYPFQPNQSYSFQLRTFLILLPVTVSFCSRAAYLLFEAHTIAEHAQAFYLIITDLCISIDFVTMYWQMGNVELLIEKYEKFIEKSRFLQYYKTLID